MQLDLGLVAMRHRAGRTTYRRQQEEIDPAEYDVVPLQGDRLAREFIATHHYSRSYPASICNVGLYRRARFHKPELVGVVTFSVPVQPKAAAKYGADGIEFCDLGRLVLLDDVPGNGESFLIRRAFALLGALKQNENRRPRYGLCIAYSDPVPRMDAAGNLRFHGHYGSVYQSTNATYLGRASKKTMVVAQDGTSVSARTLSKLRTGDVGAAGAYEQLRRLGAPAMGHGESGTAYVARAIADGPFRRVSHPGNHAYAFACGGHSTKRAVRERIATTLAFPKRTDAAVGWT